MKHLSFISSPLNSHHRLGNWEFADLGVKLLFVGMGFSLKPKSRDRSNEQAGESAQRHLVFTANNLLDAVKRINQRSGRYRDEAVPM